MGLIRKAGLLLEILVAYVQIRPKLNRLDAQDLAELARRRQRFATRVPGRTVRHQAGYLNHAINRTLRAFPTDDRCLVQSLVLCRLLAARGIDSTIVIGALGKPSFRAHAWVEVDRRPVSPILGFEPGRLVEL